MFKFYKKFQAKSYLDNDLAYESTVQVKGKLISFGIQDNDYLSIHYPDSYSQVDLSEIKNIGVGSFIQISANWNKIGLPIEKFWVEVTRVVIIGGMPSYYGNAGNDTFVAPIDSKIGPIYPGCINRVYSEDYLKKVALPKLRHKQAA
ncbi:hypothetical protein [Polynucleobacter sp. MWH-HuK1]|uniref:hypothetical protein n=1 Tax=Polynucleobacter sp. MWH-HuK1 TaxID=1743158 RepID=UPI001C0BFCEE|nr:hypothetical protein [Polynucleobacter sp. MWH-HuK1]MBU3565254.1 hypothetical protein [Polynucleobacter sp. MWH-HuK1]